MVAPTGGCTCLAQVSHQQRNPRKPDPEHHFELRLAADCLHTWRNLVLAVRKHSSVPPAQTRSRTNDIIHASRTFGIPRAQGGQTGAASRHAQVLNALALLSEELYNGSWVWRPPLAARRKFQWHSPMPPALPCHFYRCYDPPKPVSTSTPSAIQHDHPARTTGNPTT